jgi:hypothetical protein
MESTKILIGTVAGLIALVSVFALMADCSKHVADVEANPQKACLEGGGYWSRLGTMPGEVGYCVAKSK